MNPSSSFCIAVVNVVTGGVEVVGKGEGLYAVTVTKFAFVW
jgi:hypothetical protein